MRNEHEPQTVVWPTTVILEGQVSRGSDGLLDILVNPGGKGRSLAAGVSELDSDEGIVTMGKVNNALQRFYL